MKFGHQPHLYLLCLALTYSLSKKYCESWYYYDSCKMENFWLLVSASDNPVTIEWKKGPLFNQLLRSFQKYSHCLTSTEWILSHGYEIGKLLQKTQRLALKRGISDCLRTMMFYTWSLVHNICELKLLFLNFSMSSIIISIWLSPSSKTNTR